MTNTVETVKYRGHTIEINQDEYATNPFDDWDILPDIIIYSDRYTRSYGNTEFDYLPDLTEQEIRSNTKAILEETDTTTLIRFISEYGNSYLSDYVSAIDAINETLQEYYMGLYDNGKLAFLAFIYELKGVVVLNTQITGYSQGDYAELLIIASDTFLKETGATINTPEDLQFCADLYQAWAYGDTYWYNIEETEDTCSGFYGYDHRKSGLLEYAENSIDCSIRYAEEKRISKLKALIKNHAPLDIRLNYSSIYR